ncbi:hypothetical protein SEA_CALLINALLBARBZ_47 [Arthrobacter phage CallinAllBarbz]|uniref:Uncharacterized protein n=1 Tax=Arthrobacter phage CallinAllBarbz TaxID=3077790 RepID=A0AA96HD93_9CAUD|nr:hypothetical protein SEA_CALLINALLBARBZ_47 [Arthrobacter phage CallinAllBarbz]
MITTAATLRTIARTTDEALLPALRRIAQREAELVGLRKVLDRAIARGHEATIARREAEIAEDEAELEALREEIAPLLAIAEAGNWTRFVYVPGGHVHRRYCSTLYPTTVRQYLPEFSGADDAEIVEAAGSSACTVCFSDAPVVARPSTIAAVAKDRETREAEAAAKAEKAAQARSAAILDEGGRVAFKTRRGAENALGQEIKTLIYYASYVAEFEAQDGSGRLVPNEESREDYLANREERLLVPARASVNALIDLLKANGIPAEEVDELAAKKWAKAAKDAGKWAEVLDAARY